MLQESSVYFSFILLFLNLFIEVMSIFKKVQ